MGRLLPMNLPYDWGNKHPASSYVRVPTQQGVLTHSHNGRRWHQSEIDHVNLFWKLATPWYEKWPSINAEKEFGSTMFHYVSFGKNNFASQVVLRCHTEKMHLVVFHSFTHLKILAHVFGPFRDDSPLMAMSQNPGTPKSLGLMDVYPRKIDKYR